MMWGGGVKKGHVYGATADDDLLMAVKDPFRLRIYSHHLHHHGNQSQDGLRSGKAPFYATKDGIGKCATGILA